MNGGRKSRSVGKPTKDEEKDVAISSSFSFAFEAEILNSCTFPIHM